MPTARDRPQTAGSPPVPGRLPVALATAVSNVAMGILGVAFPLLALHAGHSAAMVGALVAAVAVSQFLIRLTMGAMLRRVPDKWFVVASGVLMAGSCLMMVLSAQLPMLIAAQILQGLSRAFFWTGIKTHVVRVADSSTRGLALVNSTGTVGTLVGPALAGWLAHETVSPALWCAGAAGVLTAGGALALRRLTPFPPREPGAGYRDRLLRRPGFVAGATATASAGSWRGVLSSYVPVILAEAGRSSATIGLLSSVANGTSVFGGWLSSRLGGLSRRWTLLGATAFTGLALIVLGLTASVSVVVSFVVLALAGAAVGIQQVLGGAMAVDGVDSAHRGDAIATLGTFRAAGMFAGPALMAGAVLVIPTAAAFCVVGAASAATAPAGWRRASQRFRAASAAP